MKKILLTSCLFSLFFMPCIVYSQNKCSQYILKVDSLIKADNLSIFRKDKPDSLCENSLLDFTKGKGYLGNSTAFYIRDILEYLSTGSNSDSIRKRSINELLLRSYCTDVDSYYSIRKEDFNQKARNRLKMLLRKQYSPEEEARYIKYYTRGIFKDTLYITRLAYSVNKTYREAKDSITLTILDKYKKKLYGKGYSIHLPLLMGWLNMKDCIPLLDSIQQVEGDISVMLALARLGNKKYQQYFLDHKENDMNVNFYIGTQDLIAKYGDKLYSKEYNYFIQPGEAIPIVYNVIIDLQKNISNFPRLITGDYLFKQEHIDALPPDVLEKARQWMKENKGKYIISPDFVPYFNINLDNYRKIL